MDRAIDNVSKIETSRTDTLTALGATEFSINSSKGHVLQNLVPVMEPLARRVCRSTFLLDICPMNYQSAIPFKAGIRSLHTSAWAESAAL